LPQGRLSQEEVLKKARRIRYLILDVDGVMTNGLLYFDESGREIKGFSIYDGLGIALLKEAGIGVGIISGRDSPVLRHRARELKIEDVYQGIRNKVSAYEQIALKYQLDDHMVAFVGDDLIDLPLLRRAGLSIGVANAVAAVKDVVDWVTERRGGEGAVREVADLILESRAKASALAEGPQ